MLPYTYLCVNGSLVPLIKSIIQLAIIYLPEVRCYNSVIKSNRIVSIIKLLRNVYEKADY